MSTIKIERGLVAGVTANLLKNEVRLSLSFPLDDDILDLQDQLSEPAEEKTPVTVSLSALQILEQKQVQMRLDDAPVNDDEENSEKGKDKDNGPE